MKAGKTLMEVYFTIFDKEDKVDTICNTCKTVFKKCQQTFGSIHDNDITVCYWCHVAEKNRAKTKESMLKELNNECVNA